MNEDEEMIEILLASTGVVGFAAGMIIGSVALKKFRLQGRKAAGWVAACSLVAALLSFANGAVGCKSVIGHIGDQAIANNFTFPSCRPDCVCQDMPFYPVCNTKYAINAISLKFKNSAFISTFFLNQKLRDWCSQSVNASVPPEHRSISLGFNGFLVSLFGK
uniref:Kazal-like domain-containing protein n=1 Tax=Heterorhabditis bacteriophora TaxID=37862 RepID=A0A1I7X7H5_HETBA